MASSGPQALAFTELHYKNFDVEFAEQGFDVIYHFWPKGEFDCFLPGFGKDLEIGFKNTLPPYADVRAEFTSVPEARVLASHSDMPLHLDKESRSKADVKWIPRETYYVRVVEGMKYPLADVFLKMRVFQNIEKAITERHA